MFKKERPIDRLTEERLYEAIGVEIKNNNLREGLWVKAFAEAGGDTDRAKARYIELRIQSLKDEMVVEQELHQEASRRRNLSEEAEKASTESQSTQLIAYLRRQKIGVRQDGCGWLLALNDGIKRLESLDELRNYVADHKRRAEDEAQQLKFINSIKPKLKRLRYAVWYLDGEIHLRNLKNDHKQVFTSFDEFSSVVDEVLSKK